MQLMSDVFQSGVPCGFKRTVQFYHLLLVFSGVLSGPSPLPLRLLSIACILALTPRRLSCKAPADKGALSLAVQSAGSHTSPMPGFCFVVLICVSADGPVRYYTPGW